MKYEKHSPVDNVPVNVPKYPAQKVNYRRAR